MKVFKLLLTFLCIILMQQSAWADAKITGAEPKDGAEQMEIVNPRCPRIDISANIGYGFMLSRTKGLSGEDKKMEDDLSSGLTWDFRFHSYFKSYYGLGFMYSGYHSSARYKGMDLNADITYLAPLFCIKGYVWKTKLMLKTEVGIGYLGVKQKAYMAYNSPEVVTGSTLGYNYTVGMEYQFCKYFGLGLDIDGVFGSIKTLKDARGNKYEFEDNLRMGASRINIFLGLRYYIK